MYCRDLAANLAGEGYACFIDQWGTRPGRPLPPEVRPPNFAYLRILDRIRLSGLDDGLIFTDAQLAPNESEMVARAAR